MAQSPLLLACGAILVAALFTSHAEAARGIFEVKEHKGRPWFKEELADKINRANGVGWRAGYTPRVHHYSLEAFKGMLGTRRLRQQKDMKDATSAPLPLLQGSGRRRAVELPESFDSREKWSHCPTISHIRDQGHCGSCWAFAAVETLSDRFCVGANETVDLSTNDLLSCCGDLCGDGCDGGWPFKAWQFMQKTGVVTEKCEPYFDQIGCKHPGCEPVMPTPACLLKCDDGEPFRQSKHFALNSYAVGPAVVDIMLELYTNGPVQVDFDVFEDFAYYKSGVYHHVYGDLLGGHSVKLIGWGNDKESGLPYWLIANSWSPKWGEDGYFRILRGVNEAGIEEDAVAGLAKASSTANA